MRDELKPHSKTVVFFVIAGSVASHGPDLNCYIPRWPVSQLEENTTCVWRAVCSGWSEVGWRLAHVGDSTLPRPVLCWCCVVMFASRAEA